MKKGRVRHSLERGILVAFGLCLMFAGQVHAETFMKYKQSTGAFQVMGQTQPAQEVMQETWIADNMLRSDSDGQSVIVRLDKKVMYLVDHEEQSYNELPLDMGQLLGEAGMSDEEKQQMMQFAQGMMKMTITVKETGEKKKIGAWDCRKYLQTMQTMMGPVESEIWTTQDIKIDYDLFTKLSAAGLMMMPGMQETVQEAMQELGKIKGVPVMSTTSSSMMGASIKTTQELIECKDKKATAGSFDPPKGYQKASLQ